MIQKELIELANRIRTLSQIGLNFSTDDYDIDRYTELKEISHTLTSLVSGKDIAQLERCFPDTLEHDYITPKVDVRAVVFDDQDRILMVKERVDGKWSLPGGWADVGYTPNEIAVKEVKEESGLDVEPVRLLAVLDKRSHDHPPTMYYVYKIFILCKITGGEFAEAFDILDQGFFSQDSLPVLSEDRVTKGQIDLMYEYKHNPDKQAIVD